MADAAAARSAAPCRRRSSGAGGAGHRSDARRLAASRERVRRQLRSVRGRRLLLDDAFELELFALLSSLVDELLVVLELVPVFEFEVAP